MKETCYNYLFQTDIYHEVLGYLQPLMMTTNRTVYAVHLLGVIYRHFKSSILIFIFLISNRSLLQDSDYSVVQSRIAETSPPQLQVYLNRHAGTGGTPDPLTFHCS